MSPQQYFVLCNLLPNKNGRWPVGANSGMTAIYRLIRGMERPGIGLGEQQLAKQPHRLIKGVEGDGVQAGGHRLGKVNKARVVCGRYVDRFVYVRKT